VIIEKNNVISLNFALYDGEGKLIDSSNDENLLVYLHGAEELLPALEAALDGHDIGDAIKVELKAEEAFGHRDEKLVERISRENFPGVEDIQLGMKFETEMDDNSIMVVEVVKVENEWITIDGNHELAGKNLKFELQVADIRAATEEELLHRHAHGSAGYQN
tara:strand:+ start:92 stop:577 length:486 start_codon:yes stop_codon:yes gene_type:complete